MKQMLKHSTKEPGDFRLSFFALTSIAFTTTAGILTAIWLWKFVSDYPDPSGANGYFYMKQTETLASGLGFYFKDYSLAFALPVGFMYVFKNSLDAFRAATVFVWIGIVGGVGWLTWQLAEDIPPRKKMIAVIASVTAVCACTQVYEFTLTFFKNSCAMMLVIWGAGFALASSWVAAPILLAALLTHKSMLIVLGLLLFVRLLQLRSFRQRFAILAVGILVAAIYFLVFKLAYSHLLAMLSNFQSPHGWWQWVRRLPVYNLELCLTLLALLIALCLGLALRKRFNQYQRVYVDGTLMILVLALQPFQLPGPNGPFYRFILLAPAMSIPLVSTCLMRWKYGLYVGALALAPYFVQPSLSVHEIDEVFTPWAVIASDVLKIKNYVRPEDHLTSHHGLEFFIDYTTGIRSRSFLSDHPERSDFRVVYAAANWLRNSEASQDLQSHALLAIGSEYLLMPEFDWQSLKKKWAIPSNWKNPETHRPDFVSE